MITDLKNSCKFDFKLFKDHSVKLIKRSCEAILPEKNPQVLDPKKDHGTDQTTDSKAPIKSEFATTSKTIFPSALNTVLHTAIKISLKTHVRDLTEKDTKTVSQTLSDLIDSIKNRDPKKIHESLKDLHEKNPKLLGYFNLCLKETTEALKKMSPAQTDQIKSNGAIYGVIQRSLNLLSKLGGNHITNLSASQSPVQSEQQTIKFLDNLLTASTTYERYLNSPWYQKPIEFIKFSYQSYIAKKSLDKLRD